jgi:hypothetical protein
MEESHPNHLTDGNLGEFPTFLVFNSMEESHPNHPRFDFSFDAAIYPEIQFQQLHHHPKIVTPKLSTE